MKLSVFGLGYVGTVSAACLAADGHEVVGVDPNRLKVDLINRGLPTVVERDLDGLVARAREVGRLRATASAREAVAASELSLVCVGTPSRANGDLDLDHVRRVCEEIGQCLREKDDPHLVVIRSTMLPGSMRALVLPALEAASGKRAGTDFGLCNNPEFMREGSAVQDYRQPPKTVIGELAPGEAEPLVRLYEAMEAPLVRTSLENAEMVKYVDNAWHALKVSFGNEVGTLCKAAGLDAHAVMDIFCRDTRLNLSAAYLRPGFAFGGSCLPKDLRALTHRARRLDLTLPLLEAILPSNERQLQRALRLVTDRGKRRVGVLGLAFKAGTDDLREAPMVGLVEHLLGKGYELRIYDRNVKLAALTGANRDYILGHVPHLAGLMVDTLEEVLAFAETVVAAHADPEFAQVPAALRPGQGLVDFARLTDQPSGPHYEGLCW